MEVVIALAHGYIPHCPANRCTTVPERWSHSLVAGAHSEHMLIDTVSLRPMAGIQFRPGGAGPFLGPAGLFAERHVAREDVWGRGEAERAPGGGGLSVGFLQDGGCGKGSQ